MKEPLQYSVISLFLAIIVLQCCKTSDETIPFADPVSGVYSGIDSFRESMVIVDSMGTGATYPLTMNVRTRDLIVSFHPDSLNIVDVNGMDRSSYRLDANHAFHYEEVHNGGSIREHLIFRNDSVFYTYTYFGVVFFTNRYQQFTGKKIK